MGSDAKKFEDADRVMDVVVDDDDDDVLDESPPALEAKLDEEGDGDREPPGWACRMPFSMSPSSSETTVVGCAGAGGGSIIIELRPKYRRYSAKPIARVTCSIITNWNCG